MSTPFMIASALQCTTFRDERERGFGRSHFMTVEFWEGSRDVALTVGFRRCGPVHFLSCQTHNLMASGPKAYLDTEVTLKNV